MAEPDRSRDSGRADPWDDGPPPPTRYLSVLSFGIGAGLVWLHHHRATELREMTVWLVLLAPVPLVLGLAGLLDPRIPSAATHFADTPHWARIAFVLLTLVGFGLGALLIALYADGW